LKEYRNLLVLSFLYLLCFGSAIYSKSHSYNEIETFAMDSAKQFLAAILAITALQHYIDSQKPPKP
jgi:hypothetical protein